MRILLLLVFLGSLAAVEVAPGFMYQITGDTQIVVVGPAADQITGTKGGRLTVNLAYCVAPPRSVVGDPSRFDPAAFGAGNMERCFQDGRYLKLWIAGDEVQRAQTVDAIVLQVIDPEKGKLRRASKDVPKNMRDQMWDGKSAADFRIVNSSLIGSGQVAYLGGAPTLLGVDLLQKAQQAAGPANGFWIHATDWMRQHSLPEVVTAYRVK